MSGSQPVPIVLQQGYQVVPNSQELTPREGPKSISFTVNWGDGKGYARNINLTQQVQNGIFSYVQSIFIDNTSCPSTIKLVSRETQASAIMPAFAQGIVRLATGGAPSIDIYNNTPQTTLLASTTFVLFNIPLPAYVENFDGPFGASQTQGYTISNTGPTNALPGTPAIVFQNPYSSKSFVLSALSLWQISTSINSGYTAGQQLNETQLWDGFPFAAGSVLIAMVYSVLEPVTPTGQYYNAPQTSLVFDPPYVSVAPGNSIYVYTPVSPVTYTLQIALAGTVGFSVIQ